MSTLSKRLTDLMSRAGMDITELAANIDEDEKELEEMIKNNSVDVRVLEKMAKELGVALYTLFPRPAGSILQEYYISPIKKELPLDKDDLQSKINYLEAVVEQLKKENTKLSRCLGEIEAAIRKQGIQK